MKPYPKYKQTSIAWAKEVPEHWELAMNKHKFFIKKSVVGDKSDDYTLLSLTLKGIIKRDMENPTGKFPAEFNTYQIVLPNDLVFCLFDVEETPRTVGVSDYKGMITGAYTVVESKKDAHSKFLFYYYLFLDKYKSLKCLYTGLRNTISKDTFLSLISPFPPFEEQKSIAEYLDFKLIQIDTAIDKKKQLINLLEEQKQGLVDKVITKGISDHVSFKDSNIEWLGDVPEHWVKTKLKFIADIYFSNVNKHSLENQSEIELCNYTDVYYNDFINSELPFMKATASEDEINKFQLKDGDVIATKDSEMAEDIAVPTLVVEDLPNVICGYHLALIRPNKRKVLGEYIFRLFSSLYSRKYFELLAKGITRCGLSVYAFKNMIVFLPSIDEQKQIVEFIRKELQKIKETVFRIEKEIQLLEEYKTSLIAEAVTGKIDVRDWQPKDNQKLLSYETN